MRVEVRYVFSFNSFSAILTFCAKKRTKEIGFLTFHTVNSVPLREDNEICFDVVTANLAF